MKRLKDLMIVSTFAAVVLHGGWSEVGKVVGDPDSAVSFGYSIDFDGNYAAVGDPGENAVYVFKTDEDGNWQQFSKVQRDTGSLTINEFGTDVAIDDQQDIGRLDVVLAIGSPKVNYHIGQFTLNASGVFVYRLNDSEDGFDLNKTFISNYYNSSGMAIDLDSYKKLVNLGGGLDPHLVWVATEILASGKPIDGEVELHYYSDLVDWNQTTVTPSAGDGTRFGESVSLSIKGDQWYLAVGAPDENVTHYNRITGDTTTYEGKGAVYLYRLDEGIDPLITANNEYRIHQHIPDYFLVNSGIVENSAFGTAVDLENNGTTYDDVRLIVGAKKENIGHKSKGNIVTANEGEACVYKMTAEPPSWEWSRVGYPLTGSTISSVNDGFGLHVAVNGNLAVVSAPMIDGEKGAVFAYDYNGTSWIQRSVLQPANAGGFGNDVDIVNGQVVSSNQDHKEVSIFEYEPNHSVGTIPAIIMYLLH